MRALAAAVVALAFAASSAPARADDGPTAAQAEPQRVKKKKKKARKKAAAAKAPPPLFDFSVDVDGELAAGAFTGAGIRHTPGVAARARMELEPQARLWIFEGSAPVRLEHTGTAFASLDETEAAAGLSIGIAPWKQFRAYVEADVDWTVRPAWLDLYQPLPDGDFATSDRFGRLARSVDARIASTPFAHHHARAKYTYSIVDTPHDPNFDPVLRPNHLVPLDRDEHSVDASWRWLGDRAHLGVSVDAWTRQYFFAFARDAKTGLTHAGPGGAPPNPLLVLRGVDVKLQAGWEALPDRLDLELEPLFTIVDDPYQGYQSSIAAGARMSVDARLPADVHATAKLAATQRWYEVAGYAAGGRHRPLDFGVVREDRRASLGLEVHRALMKEVELFVEGAIDVRRTNFPDSTTIQRDWTQARTWAGIKVHI